jgi:hypothetical protein
MKLLLLCFSLAIAGTVSAGDAPVPQAVTLQFARLYPGVEVPVWEERGNGSMAAHFPSAQGLKTAVFRADGQWLHTKLRLHPFLLPQPVQAWLQQTPAGARLTFSGRVYDHDQSWYRFEYEFADRLVRRETDRQGRLLREETIYYSLSPTLALP